MKTNVVVIANIFSLIQTLFLIMEFAKNMKQSFITQEMPVVIFVRKRVTTMQNEMRERLVELLGNRCCNKQIPCENCEYENFADCHRYALADHLLENGVILLPCKAGDIVYSNDLDPRFDVEIERIVIEENVITFEWVQYEKGYEVTECWDEGEFSLEDFSKTVFVSREEAEKALAERQSKNEKP